MGRSPDRRAIRRPTAIPPGTRLTARVFRTGNSQAVRLPKEMRFSTSEVTVHREGRRLVLEPLEIERDKKGWPKVFWTLGGSAPDFEVGDRGAPHERRDALGPRR